MGSPNLKQIHSHSTSAKFQTIAGATEGIEMIEMTQSNQLHEAMTLSKLIPHSFVYKDNAINCENAQSIRFDEAMLESTMDAIIQSNKGGDAMYFCVLLSYVRYASDNLTDEMYRKRMYESDEEEKEEKQFETSSDCKIECAEISIFEAPTAICSTHQIAQKTKTKQSDA